MNRVRKITRMINEAIKLKSIFTIVGCGSLVAALAGMILVGSLTDEASIGAFVALSIITFIFASLFIFSGVVVTQCEAKIESWKEIRNYLIVKSEKDKSQFEIANAFANCYWHALDNINDPETDNNRLELTFSQNQAVVDKYLDGK